jgi:hypothetical protein
LTVSSQIDQFYDYLEEQLSRAYLRRQELSDPHDKALMEGQILALEACCHKLRLLGLKTP